MSYPSQFNSVEEWHKVVDKMIWSFDKHIKDDFSLIKTDALEEEVNRYKEELQLFAEHFGDLWD